MLTVVFLGTPAFSVPGLEALLADERFVVKAVITPPDKPAGRGQALQPPPVKQAALASGIQVFQTPKIRQDEALLAWLAQEKPDFLVTIAFGQILSQAVLDIPRYGTVNVHASLLPALRGANPIQHAILQGHAQTGLTTMMTELGVDTGPMIRHWTTDITPQDTAITLAQRLSQAAGPLLCESLLALAQKAVVPQVQNEAQATHAAKLNKADAVLDWSQPAEQLSRKIRGQQPSPGAVTWLGGKRVKCLGALVEGQVVKSQIESFQPGTLLGVCPQGVRVQAGQGSVLVLTHVQPEGKPKLEARAWANGLGLAATSPPLCFEAPLEQ